ncbi:MAG TPA: L,D-transpeptidase [Pseudonocardiaceae bacterium]|jgi:lipoprotein-anchoring transpeptidase ErfK/SrfK|nr:L,D-transpeptidase [Pseudonocardiaceae bacterium]
MRGITRVALAGLAGLTLVGTGSLAMGRGNADPAGPADALAAHAPATRSVPSTALDTIVAQQADTQSAGPPPCEATAVACVSLSQGYAWLVRDGSVLTGPVPIGHGVGDNATPTGIFHVSWKAKNYTSHEYHEPMPDAIFFAAGGIAFHAGSLDTSSHGCVHLAPDVADQFFATLSVGDEVQVLA